ncbi:MAG: NADH-quinone oxidoreductase subunit H [Gemmatimonadota bacterium]|nr:NADH-quinone oxidoreductase subunit H [Gemmatimonadota bacterium]
MTVTLGLVLALSAGTAVIAGVYFIAVLDAMIADVVAGARCDWQRALAAPLHVAAHAFVQRNSSTERPDRALWSMAPALLGALAASVLFVVPLGSADQGRDTSSGIVLVGAAMALVMVAVFVHGWAANSVFPLIGGYRFVAQALSYEMPLALVLIATALPARSLALGDLVQSQGHVWNIVRQPLGLPLYIVAGLGLAFWGPMNSADGADIVGGTAAEASGTQRLSWQVARHAILLAVAALGATAFLGGWLGPVLPGVLWLALKTACLLAVMITAGHLFARVRLERFVTIAWIWLIPLALVDVFASGILTLMGTTR